MLLASDLAGPGLGRGFPPYLTGYDLPDDGKYVLARTWAALDVERPGCVYTHSLVLRLEDLTPHRSLSGLLDLFLLTPDRLAVYERPIDAWPVDASRKHNGAVETVGMVLFSTSEPVFVSRVESADEVAMRLWELQWPRLRREFRFSTCSPVDRSESTQIRFDLQFVTDGGRTQAQTYSRAPILVTRDLFTPDPEFEEFLFRYGPECELGRVGMGVLHSVFAGVRDGAAAPDILQRLEDEGASGMLGLRRDLFHPESHLRSPTATDLMFLTANSGWRRSGLSESDAGAWAQYWLSGPLRDGEWLAELFREPEPTEFGEAFLGEIIQRASVDLVAELDGMMPGVIESFVSAQPSLVRSPDFWQIVQGGAEPVWQALSDKDVEVTRESALSFLQARPSEPLPPSFARSIGSGVTFALLDEARQFERAPDAWLRAISERPLTDIVHWLSEERRPLAPAQLQLVMYALRNDLAGVSPQTWERVLPKSIGLRKLGTKAADRLAVRLMLVGLDGIAPSFIGLSFGYLHERLAEAGLEDGWADLRAVLPDVEVHRFWDKCERLRRGVVLAWSRAGWPPDEFWQAIVSVRLEVLTSARKVPAAHVLLSELVERVELDHIGATSDEFKALRKARKKTR
jgi:hypothetical protein